MAEILSQQQIDELLSNLQNKKVDINEIKEKQVKKYDFLSPKQFSRGQLKLLETVFSDFIKMFGSQLTGMLRATSKIEVLQVEEQKYREFINALNESVLVGVIGMHNEQNKIDGKQMMIELSRPISFAIIDRMLGGNGGQFKVDRDYTDIEMSLLEYLFKQMLPFLQNAWSDYLKIDHSLDYLATNSRLLQFIQPDESVAIVVAEINIDDVKGNMNICLPASALETVFKIYNSKYDKPFNKEDPEEEKQRREEIIGRIEKSSLTVSAILGTADISLHDLCSLHIGDVVMLDTLDGKDETILTVEEMPWFTGLIGSKNNKYAVKIKNVIS